MNKLLRQAIILSALLSMALLGVAHANSPIHEQAKDFQECTFCLHHAGTQLHTTPDQIHVPQPVEVNVQSELVSDSEVFVRPIRPFNGRAPPQFV
ncbi:hypothetical protein KS2013_2193 [Kangiella sediminilitoris]|uniref:Uncharacterized protein n=2 Tax=Kangiella sediminilitoris TaxID=1144748 RepID=A0A1B3BDQ2_9GAMM|nr:hypothetical protein KS2013_2193 [Kangiella sediminilitoris]